MKVRRTRLGMLLVAVTGLVVVAVPPASATTVRASVFTGTLTLSNLDSLPQGLTACAPLGCVTVTTGPSGEPQPQVSGGSVGFTFTSSACLSLSATSPGGSGGLGAATCTVTAVGTLTGFEGAASGSGVLRVTDNFFIGLPDTFDVAFTFTIVGNVMTVAGNTNEEVFRAVIALAPGSNSTERRGGGLSGRSS